MKLIANSDFSLIVEKLPEVLDYARQALPKTDMNAINTVRRLSVLAKKLKRIQTTKKLKQNDKK